jgi:hypothetical protein
MSQTRNAKDSIRTNPGRKGPEKTIDLPPYGPRNADPLTDAPGAHPIETGIGAAVGGAASGLAVGAVGGPVGAVAGAIVGGALAGGLAGKGIGELLDPTTEDNWLRDRFGEREEPSTEEELAAQRRAYRFGLAAQSRFAGRMFRDVEPDLRRAWEGSGETAAWGTVREPVQAGFDRTAQIPVTRSAEEGQVASRH